MLKLYRFPNFLLAGLLLSLGLSLGLSQPAQAQQGSQPGFQSGSATVAGRVATEADEPLVGATVFVKGSYVGASTNSAGDFALRVSADAFPLTLVVSYGGYETQSLTVGSPNERVVATLIPQRALVRQLVVAASRQEENILQAPVTVEKVTAAQVQGLSNPDLMSALARFRGVDANASGLLVNSLSTRGFGSPTSERVVQLVDYLDTQSPSLSFNIGNSLSIADVDVASVEILSGPSSVLYGANAFNGVVAISSRDAFTDPGLTVRLRGGERDYLDGQLRYAQRLGRRLAFKVTGSGLSAREWSAANYDPLQTVQGIGGLNNLATSNLGYNVVNRYGDLPFTYPTDPSNQNYAGPGLAGRTVYLPGFAETDLLADDNKARLYRGSVSVGYLLSDRVKATLEYSRASGSATLQNIDRFRARDFSIDRFRLEVSSPDRWFVRAYQTLDAGNNSYDLTYLGLFLQNVVNPATGASYAQSYVGTYAVAYNLARRGGASDAAALALARQAAASQQLVPGSADYNAQRERLLAESRPGLGARLNPNSYLCDVSGQYNFDLADNLRLVAGGAYREFRLGSAGTFFSDRDGERILNYEYGAYAQLSATLFDEHLRLAAAGRVDNFRNFDTKFSPRLSAVYSLGDKQQHNFRVSFGQAFRSPTQTDQYLAVDLGVITILGNVGQGFQGYSGKLVSDFQSGQLNPANLGSYELNLKRLTPERVSSYEIGYKSQLADRLLLDVSYYRSQYRDFLAAIQFVGNPDGSRPSPTQLFNYAQNPAPRPGDVTRLIQTQYNLTPEVRTQGAVLALTFAANPALNLTGNYALNVLDNSSDEVPFFNTPRHKFNAGAFGNLTKTLGYSLNYRHAEGYRYASAFAVGDLAPYQAVDAQLRLAVPALKTTFELGGTNLFNSTNVQVFGGPQIGRLLYGGLTVSVK